MGETRVCFQVFTKALDVVIRNPTHIVPSCDSSPLLVFSTIGEDNVCGEPDCVRAFIDGIEVSITRIGDAYGYDYYGADDKAGWVSEDCYGYSPGPDHGYGLDDGYGQDGYAGTIDDGYGSDRLPGTLHIFQLPDIADGRHTIRVVVQGTSGIASEATETFIVDTTPPVITIVSPVTDTVHPLSEVPTLIYTIQDFSGVADVKILIDNKDYGWLPSGTVLDFLKSGFHSIKIIATDNSTGGCGTGNVGKAKALFNLLKSIKITEIARRFYVGTNATTQDKPVDGIIEEFRVLNQKSTEADVLNEFKILQAKIRFQLHTGSAALSPEDTFILQQIGADPVRICLPDQSLMLCHYDNNVNSLPGVNALANHDNQVIDPTTAGNRIDVTVFYNEGDRIDREIITEIINRMIPAFTQASIRFEMQVQS
jgi:hypothetical protein